MLNKGLFCCLVLLTVLQFQGISGQGSAPLRSRCGEVGFYFQCGAMGSSRTQCLQNPNCCYNSTIEPSCYSNTFAATAQMATSIQAELPRVGRPQNANALRTLTRSLQDVGIARSSTVDVSIRARITNLQTGGLAPLLTSQLLPECAVRTPFCQRVACNTQNPSSQSDPLQCLQDASCCFDGDLFLYRQLFGPAFMNGAPVCYYGPTSSRYRQLANLVQPYNAFFQTIIVDLFQEYLDNGLNFQERIICAVTTGIGNLGGIGAFLQSPQCGWAGITELECNLKGCCWDGRRSICVYPTTNPIFGNFAAQNQEFYPELLAQSPDETTCTNPRQISPNIYRRLPCRSPSGTGSSAIRNAFLTCPRQSCCANPFGLIPGLFELTLISSGGLGLTSSQIPLLAASGGFGGSTGPDISQLFCPYLFFPIPNFPNLLDSTAGCCIQHVCYHRKQGAPPSWGSWSRYGACSTACGAGQRRRSRTCVDFGGNQVTGCSGQGFEDQSCTGTQCCTWSQWTSGVCNAPCGLSGTQTRTRQCFNPQAGTGCNTCPGRGSEQRPCQGSTNCGLWATWRNWGGCNARCGTTGQRTRSRTCRDRTTGQVVNTCSGSGTQRITCQGTSCCRYTEWSAYGSCDAGCGGFGNERRNRQCIDSSGGFCNTCTGSSTQSRSCQGPACCSWTAYGPFSACNAACGQQGSQTRTRNCRDSNGNPCGTCPGSNFDSRPCTGPTCFTFSDWTTWSTCSSSCRRERSRSCEDGNNNRVNDRFCGDGTRPRTDRNSCIGAACLPVVSQPWISWGPWQQWGSCSESCGRGVRVRERICYYRGRENSPLHPNICACSYPNGPGGREEGVCIQPPCSNFPFNPRTPPSTLPTLPPTLPTLPPTLPPNLPQYLWSEWSAYTACTSAGTRTRSRSCIDVLNNQQVNSVLCAGGSAAVDTETEQCAALTPTPAPDDCTGGRPVTSPWSTCRCERSLSITRRFRIHCCVIPGNRQCTNQRTEYDTVIACGQPC